MAAPAFVVISGAAAGAFYVRQLLRAAAAGRLELGPVHVVDRDPHCAAAAFSDPRVRLHVAEWDDWLDAELERFAPDDQLVPYHWAPHLLLGWLERQARRAGLRTERGGALGPSGLPFEAATGDGSRALSYATWPCPPACIEPALCPHTRGPRDWSLCGDLDGGRLPADERLVLRCLHFAWGVGTIPLRDLLAARQRVLDQRGRGERRLLVATASHCHGLAALLTLR